MKNVLFIALGMFLMYIILKILSSGLAQPVSATTAQIKALVQTPEVANLLRTNEAREVIKTAEFRSFVGSLAKDQITAISKSLLGYTKL